MGNLARRAERNRFFQGLLRIQHSSFQHSRQSHLSSTLAFLKLSLKVGTRYIGYLLATALILSLCFVSVFQTMLAPEVSSVSVCDLIIWAYDPDDYIAFLWFVCPVVVMLVLIYLWRETENVYTVTHQYSTKQRWFIRVCEAAVLSFVVAVAVHVGLVSWGFVFLDGFCNFEQTGSWFEISAGAVLNENLSAGWFLPVTGLYAFLSLMCTSLLFCLLYVLLKRPAVAFICASFLNLGYTHSDESFIYDIMHNIIGGSLFMQNPLAFLYHTADISYATWLFPTDIHLWGLLVEVICFAFLGWLLFRKRDFLR